MSALLKETPVSMVDRDIELHPAWLGQVTGLKAEKMMRGKKAYMYVLRTGEPSDQPNVTNFYVTFVNADLTVKHQPFVVTLTPQGWMFENYGCVGPFMNVTIDDVLHSIMHCQKGENTPLVNFQK